MRYYRVNKDSVLAEIEQYYRRSAAQPDDITLADVTEQLGVCEQTARDVMKKLVAAGKFTAVKVIVGQHAQTVWRKVEKE